EGKILQTRCAELAAVNLVKAGVQARARPPRELLEVGVDDDPEPAVISQGVGHAAARIAKSVAVIGESELQSRLLELRAPASDISDLAQDVRQRLQGWVRLLLACIVGRSGAMQRRDRDHCGDHASCNTTAAFHRLHGAAPITAWNRCYRIPESADVAAVGPCPRYPRYLRGCLRRVLRRAPTQGAAGKKCRPRPAGLGR